MNIFVAGAAGFLGSHVADALSEAGHQVVCFDIRPSIWTRSDQIALEGTLLDLDKLIEVVEGCDAVFNFAALADLNEGLTKPLETVMINVLGNCNLLEASRRCGVKRFLYASTVYVQSRAGGFYRCSKQSAESYVEEYAKQYGLDYTILRYGSLYGPRSGPNNGLYRIVEKALVDGFISYTGSADSLREYIHVSDAASASVEALSAKFVNQKVILTGQEAMKVVDMLEMLREIMDFKAPIKFVEGEQTGHYIRTPYSYPDGIGKKFIPPLHVDLGQGLLQLIDIVKRDQCT